MKKGDIVEGEVISIAFPNKGKVQLEDRVASVKGVIKGQKVRVRIKRSNKERCQATLLEVVEKSDLENAVPKCPHFGLCGGCSYQTMSYDNQLKLKKEIISDLLSPFTKEQEIELEEIIRSPLDYGYRNKMEFSFGDEFKGGPLALGMHKKNSTYDIVYTSDCKIVNDDMTKVLRATVHYFRELNIPFYHK
ncbi:MAG: 23S rRNA (uracil-5-)-methyltransferase RumA, partial [Lachnospiraceae bacterium]|nr:23S rRNA (uracil-5-)-methyltransferase RumA [Lachnospiraceae bacterium]